MRIVGFHDGVGHSKAIRADSGETTLGGIFNGIKKSSIGAGKGEVNRFGRWDGIDPWDVV